MPESKYCRCGRRYTAPGQDVCDLCKWSQQKAIDLYIELQNRAIVAERKIKELKGKLKDARAVAIRNHERMPTQRQGGMWFKDQEMIAEWKKEDDQAEDASGEPTRGQQNQS